MIEQFCMPNEDQYRPVNAESVSPGGEGEAIAMTWQILTLHSLMV